MSLGISQFERDPSMRILLGALAVLGLVLPTFAGDPVKKEPVRELAVKIAAKGQPKGGGPKDPTVIKSAEDLAKAFADEDTRMAVAKEVDFAKEQVVFFSWG